MGRAWHPASCRQPRPPLGVHGAFSAADSRQCRSGWTVGSGAVGAGGCGVGTSLGVAGGAVTGAVAARRLVERVPMFPPTSTAVTTMRHLRQVGIADLGNASRMRVLLVP